MSPKDFEDRFNSADSTVVAWFTAHPKAALVILGLVLGVLISIVVHFS